MTRHRQLRSHGHPVRVVRCTVSGKIRYATQCEAALVLAGLDRTDPERREQNSYRCNACRGWHLTSWTPADYVHYIGALHPTTTPCPPHFDSRDAVPAARLGRQPRSLTAIGMDSIAVPSPAEVAARTAPAPTAAQAPSTLEPVATASLPLETIHTAAAQDNESAGQPVPITCPRRDVPSPAQVAARTVPIKRAEAVRRQAELSARTAEVVALHNPTVPAVNRNTMRTLMTRLLRRLRRG